jgi:hypothetical protein
MIVEFVAEPPVPNVYLGEEHIPSHLCSVRHKRTTFTLQGPPPSKPIPPDLPHPLENHIPFICAQHFSLLDRLLP